MSQDELKTTLFTTNTTFVTNPSVDTGVLIQFCKVFILTDLSLPARNIKTGQQMALMRRISCCGHLL